MTKTITATEARVHFGELMRRVVEDNEQVIVERGGKPQVVVLSIDTYERMQTSQPAERPEWQVLLERAHDLIRAEGRPMPDVVELIRESREERDAQILDAVLGCEPRGPAVDGTE